jgi:pyruvate/2-oxoglutarate dehydrogenase complex dihydrolipoamide dehydrogenase (E3) component
MDEVARGEGMTLHTGVVEAERLLVATGRRLDLDGLGVEAAGLDPDAPAVTVDPHLRARDGLWAVGDVTGTGAFTHVAVYQGRIAAADILGIGHQPADYTAVPRVTFTDPEVAGVGLTEAQAQEVVDRVRAGVASTASSARGWIHGPGAAHGVVKRVADAGRGVLVGGSVMGPAAAEVIGLLVLAIRQRIPVAALRELIYPYPTFVRGVEDALQQLA